ncbi:hypothetical protein CANARDRAFT_25144 [[Candida] arabinofermentans NRRL YB-2248]|uniref:F-box domain-containing protein n=1 Tax=[Candida] arabinofermentans NRRL YB-2248 TaxID=983967 RepID=A0A1E4SV20_9ASCO|nr:hypothetical protein CANARDRAFT_25144 [[Candida] arabinofermentans NRRL YB-2248]
MSQEVSSDVVIRALELGQQEFKRGSYGKALKILARGIAMADDQYKEQKDTSSSKPKYHPKYIMLLDSRSACYEKLNKLNYAQLDADRMISLEPYSCRGYLRCSKILCGSNSELEALKILQTGIEKIKSGKLKYKDRLVVSKVMFTKMMSEKKRLCDKLQVTVSQDKRKRSLKVSSETSSVIIKKLKDELDENSFVDPVSSLPFELICEIFKYLDQKTILEAMLVSKSWNKTLISIPQLLDSPILKRKIRLDDFVKFLSFYNRINSGRKLKQIGAISLNTERQDEIRIFTKFMMSGFLVSQLKLELSVVNNIEFGTVVNNNTNARRLMSNLSELELHIRFTDRDSRKNSNSTTDLLSFLPTSLTKLSLSLYSGEVIQEASETREYRQFANMKSLSVFNHSDGGSATSISNVNSWVFKNHGFPAIEELQLIRVDASQWTDLVAKSRFLKHLHLSKSNISLTELLILLSSLTNQQLQTLFLDEYSGSIIRIQHLRVNQLSLDILGNLRSLSIIHSSISTEGLNKIIDATNGNLESLTLANNSMLVFKGSGFDIYQSGGLVVFADFLPKLPKLQRLSLVNCVNFTDFTMKMLSYALASMSGPKNLKVLDVSGNAISGVGVLELFQARDCSNVAQERLL